MTRALLALVLALPTPHPCVPYGLPFTPAMLAANERWRLCDVRVDSAGAWDDPPPTRRDVLAKCGVPPFNPCPPPTPTPRPGANAR